jgi:hypothetical protein
MFTHPQSLEYTLITITASCGSKRSHPTESYGSLSAQASLSGEAATMADVAPVMRDLLAAAQAGCDQHLADQIALLTAGAVATPPTASRDSHPQTSVQPHPQSAAVARPQSTAASQPYRSSQRRGPAPVTDNQLRFLERLIQQTNSSVPAILEQHQVGALRDLSCKAAAGLIDELKNQGART